MKTRTREEFDLAMRLKFKRQRAQADRELVESIELAEQVEADEECYERTYLRRYASAERKQSLERLRDQDLDRERRQQLGEEE